MLPTPVLLAHVLLDIAASFDRCATKAGEKTSLVLGANLLRVIPSEGISVTDLAPAARISRRVVRSWLTSERRQGRVEVEDASPRGKTVRLTDLGRRTRDRWGELIVTAEQQWCAAVGADLVGPLRAALEAVVSRLDLELPHYPITYGPADTSVLGGRAVAAKPGPPRIPPHGTDWVPVVREDRHTSGLPLHALFAQTLMAFTVDYEERARFPMAPAAILAHAMPDGALPLSDVPPILGVNGSGKSGLERHGIVRVTDSGAGRVAELTTVGLRIRDNHDATLLRVEQGWRDRYGGEIVDDLTAGLGSVDAVLGDRPDHVLVRHAAGMGFRDVSSSY